MNPGAGTAVFAKQESHLAFFVGMPASIGARDYTLGVTLAHDRRLRARRILPSYHWARKTSD
jgi:hypothetical protein